MSALNIEQCRWLLQPWFHVQHLPYSFHDSWFSTRQEVFIIIYKMRFFHTNDFVQIEPPDLWVSITSWFSFFRSHSNCYRSKQQYISRHCVALIYIKSYLCNPMESMSDTFIGIRRRRRKKEEFVINCEMIANGRAHYCLGLRAYDEYLYDS